MQEQGEEKALPGEKPEGESARSEPSYPHSQEGNPDECCQAKKVLLGGQDTQRRTEGRHQWSHADGGRYHPAMTLSNTGGHQHRHHGAEQHPKQR